MEEDNLYLEVEKIVWIDEGYQSFTTLVVYGYFYTFQGDLDDTLLDQSIALILDNLEYAEEEEIRLEMPEDVYEIIDRAIYQTCLLLN